MCNLISSFVFVFVGRLAERFAVVLTSKRKPLTMCHTSTPLDPYPCRGITYPLARPYIYQQQWCQNIKSLLALPTGPIVERYCRVIVAFVT